MKKTVSFFVGLLFFVTVLVSSTLSTTAAPSITIGEPANGQTFTGNSFAISGTATPNSAVLLSRDGLTIAQTRANSEGKWNTTLSNLPDGDNGIAVRAVTNNGYAYFDSVAGDMSTVKTNQMRLADNVINPNAPYPVQHAHAWLGLLPNLTNDKLFHFGSFTGLKPALFDTQNPVASTQATGYPDNASSNTGAFNKDSTKFYSPNMAFPSISVVDTATNAWEKDITLPATPVTAFLGTDDNIYVASGGAGPKFWVINTTTDTIIRTIDVPCTGDSVTTQAIFSNDRQYPYFYAACFGGAGKVVKLKISDGSVVNQKAADVSYSNGILNGDNSKLYFSSSAAQGWGGTPNDASDKLYVHNPDTGDLINTIQMTAGVVGIAQSPDLQHIYAATPGKTIPLQSGFDIVDMLTDEKVSVSTDEPMAFIATQPLVAEAAVSNVAVVLGVKTSAGGSLANTGVMAVSATLLAGIVLGSLAYVYWDYRRHKKPLVAEDHDVHYTLIHHVKVVTLPMLRYRLSFQFEQRRSDDGPIHKF